jgi:NADH:ubiquinone oxidoreductase subunit 6 (subunit J)
MIQPLLFYTIAGIIVLFAILVVSVRNIFHAGLFLIGTFLGVAGIYLTLFNYFLAAVQALVYSGAIAVLILFGVMLTQKHYRKEDPSHHRFRFLAFLLSLSLLVVMVLAYGTLPPGSIAPVDGLLHQIGEALMQAYVLPFEIISILLLVALIGAFVLAREKEET